MIKSASKDHELKRLKALHHLNILDTPNEEGYDTITKAIRELYNVPIALVSLTDADRQWFKSNQGMALNQTDRSVSFTPYAILNNDFFIVPDALKDERFANSPLVTGGPKIRFYASYPLRSKDGYRVGALCILDTKPRYIEQSKLEQLKNFALLIEKEFFEKRRTATHLEEIAKIQEHYIRGTDKSQLFDYILKVLLQTTNSEYGFIGGIKLDKFGHKYLKTYAITNVAWNKETQECYNQNAPSGLVFSNLNTLFGHTINTGELVISNDPKNDPRAGHGMPDGHPKLNAYLGAPIYGQTGLVAMYGIANRPGGYNQEIVNDLRTITNTITAIIESTRNIAIIDNMAKRDPLTPTYNRNYFKTKIEELITRNDTNSSTHENQFCLMMIDFNDFKSINDYYGHLIGDQLLVELIHRLEPLISKDDFISRIGGDEFTILLNNPENIAQAEKLAEKIVQISKEPYIIERKKIYFSVSIGLVFYPNTGKTFGDLMRRADFALYKAKKNPQQYQFYSDELEKLFNYKKTLEKELIAAIEQKQFYLVYQPQIDTKNNTIYGLEVLARWQHPEGKEILPNGFIPVIKKLGMSEAFNFYIVNLVTKQLSQHYSSGSNPKNPSLEKILRISINISPHVQNFSKHLSELIKIISEKQLHPNIQFEFEITEENFMTNDINSEKKLFATLKKLTKANIRLAIDDFGIKHSSISRLVSYDFNTIKIDASFIKKLTLPNANAAKAVISAITYLAKKLNFNVVAEGVETKQQAEILHEIHCYIMQGYYYHKPMSWREVQTLISH